MTRRKPLSKRLTALSLARNLTSKQEHQLVAAADRARHLEADLAAALEKVARVEELLDAESPYGEDVPGPWLRTAVQGNDWRDWRTT